MRAAKSAHDTLIFVSDVVTRHWLSWLRLIRSARAGPCRWPQMELDRKFSWSSARGTEDTGWYSPDFGVKPPPSRWVENGVVHCPVDPW